MDFCRFPPAVGPRGHARARPAPRAADGFMAAANPGLRPIPEHIAGVAGALPFSLPSSEIGGLFLGLFLEPQTRRAEEHPFLLLPLALHNGKKGLSFSLPLSLF